MGQYHILVNVDKKEKVEPHGLGLGLKQYEHTGNFEGTLADAMYILMMTSPARGGGDFPATAISGRWKGDRVLILGDYTEDSDIPSIPKAGSLFRESDETYTDISNEVAKAFEDVFRIHISGDGWKTRTRLEETA
jgi:hypothetical protein